VTVYSGDPDAGIAADTEAAELWKKLFNEKGVDAGFADIVTETAGYERGMHPGERIFGYRDKNWWSRAGAPEKMPAGEPGGPDSEIFFDFGTPHDSKWGPYCHPNCDCGRFVEIGNSVFMQFMKNPDGTFSELPKQNIDFGGGLERITMATVGADIFLINVFDAARKVLEEKSGKKYGQDEAANRSFRIILDHMRAASFMLGEGTRPSNTEAGYILRRLIRRSIREADKLGIKNAVLADVAEGYGDAYVEQYPFVKANRDFIRDELTKEEAQFRKTLTNGLRELEKMGNDVDAFTLYTTYGFPIEMTEELAKERGITIDKEAVAKLIEEHQTQSRAGAAQKFAGGLADHAEQTIRYHTTHHILLKALQMVLGPDVHQRGSNITSERLRLDFASPRKMTPEEVKKVEDIVNEKIQEELPVIRSVMKQEDAEKLGAEHEFGAQYPEMVSVYSVGPKDATEVSPNFSESFSIEYCGGPHVANTKEIKDAGTFKILKEEASSSGIRRIKAVIK
jgi:alanyl-tRNA synthetase